MEGSKAEFYYINQSGGFLTLVDHLNGCGFGGGVIIDVGACIGSGRGLVEVVTGEGSTW